MEMEINKKKNEYKFYAHIIPRLGRKDVEK